MAAKNPEREQQMLQQLRELLLIEDRKAIAEIQQVIETREDLAERVDPIIETHLQELQENFPDAYVRVVQKIVDQRMLQKQDELINIIYPRLGLMIKKFIAHEFKVLRENIDSQIRKSPLAFVYKNRNKSADEVILELSAGSQVEEVYVISHESGLLLGSASASQTADKDMIAGMLTAIKSFVEDAFKRTDEELSAIQYGSYEIMVQNFFNYYIALAIKGTISEQDRQQLMEQMLKFAKDELQGDLQEPEAAFYGRIQQALFATFINPTPSTSEAK